MQLPWLDHFHNIVIPAWQDYLRAEDALSLQVDAAALRDAEFRALRLGASAAILLHHFADVVWRASPTALPRLRDEYAARRLASGQCTSLHSQTRTRDVELLTQLTNALKHCVLTQGVANLQIDPAGAVLVLTTQNPGLLEAAEARADQAPQLAILCPAGARHRALQTVLQNVIDAWRRVAGLRIPPIGAP
jgi:hypothetical protein